MNTNGPEKTDRPTDEEWLKQRWAPWCPEGERQDYLDDLKAQLQHSRQQQEPAGEENRENLCRSNLDALEEALTEENERMRAAYRRAGL